MCIRFALPHIIPKLTASPKGSTEPSKRLNVEGYLSDSTANKMFASGRDYVERPVTKQKQTANSDLIRSIVNKNNNNPSPMTTTHEVNDDQLPILSPNFIPRTSGNTTIIRRIIRSG